MNDQAEAQVVDPGLDETVRKLTPERIEKAIKTVLGPKNTRLKVYLDTCMHCGLCAESCHTYLSRGRDPNWSPVAKVKDTVWEMVKREGKVDAAFIKKAAQIVFTQCNGCRRCSMYCPFGIDIIFFIGSVRRICHLLGVVPAFLQDTVNSHSATSNQMWIQQDEWIDALMWQEDDARAEVPGTRIPLDKEGAEIMYSVIAPEPKILAQLLANMAVIMKAAKVDWTMPSTDGWDNSNMAMMTSDFETMARVERLHWDRALQLKVKRVVMGECGHAFRASIFDGPRWLGWRHPPLPMVHAVDYYYELISTGRLKIARKIKEPVTVQDPCNISRGYGLHHKLRYVLRAICEDFREVSPRFEHNYCCGAGGGAINCGPIWKPTRMRSVKVKAEQFAATGAKIIVTPCHNCHGGVEDVIKWYDLKMHTAFVNELLIKTIER